MARTLYEKILNEMEMSDRHLRMLKVTKENQPIGIIRLSEITQIPKHKIRYSLRLLEREGLIQPSPEGARVTEKYEEFLKETKKNLDKISELLDSIKENLN